MKRRGFLGFLVSGAVMALAPRNVPVLSGLARKATERDGVVWFRVVIGGKERWIPAWK